MKSNTNFLLCVCFILSIAISFQEELVKLPNFPYDRPVYSGFLDIPGTTKSLHYFYLPSQNDPITDPLVLWLNGGPGCSSLLGFSQEHGPALFKPSSTEFEVNGNSWNKLASMIYLEMPAGVGYSTGSDEIKVVSDESSGNDNLQAILKFILEVHPEMRQLEFYISGESYAGIYVPTLAYKIAEYNKRVMENKKINLKGIVVGNGIADLRGFFTAFYELAYTHFLYPESLKERFDKFCKNGMDSQARCQSITKEIDAFLDGINIYDIYRKCFVPPKPSINLFFDFNRNPEEAVYHNVKHRSYTPWLKNSSKLSGDPPCSDTYGPNVYFNKAEVKDALFLKDATKQWEFCSDVIYKNYQWNFEHGSVELYPKLIKENIRIWIYSGDTDLAVPVNDTLRWIENLKLPVEQGWTQWRVNTTEIAGFRINYQGLTLVTVKGVGHMVPQWKPEEAFKLFNTFLKGNDLVE